MTRSSEPNPYEILQLNTRAEIPEILRRSRELTDETMDGDRQTVYRRAAEELREHPVKLACHQFWEPPGTNYHVESFQRFRQVCRGPTHDQRTLQRRSRQFAQRDCSPQRLAAWVIPPLTATPCDPRLADFPLEQMEVTLERWELFLESVDPLQ